MPKVLTLDDFNKSTFKVRFSSKNNGSCLLCRYDEKHVLLFSAWHVFTREHSQFAQPFDHNAEVQEIQFELVRSSENLHFYGKYIRPIDDSDICAILFEDDAIGGLIDYADIVTSNDFAIGDEVFMFGFPFITDDDNIVFAGNPVDSSYMHALLKHGYVMGAARMFSRDAVLFDMHSNPGFSGGPIVKKCCVDEEGNVGYSFLGVMSGSYRNVDDEHKPIEYTNAGMSYGCASSKIIEYLPTLFSMKWLRELPNPFEMEAEVK